MTRQDFETIANVICMVRRKRSIRAGAEAAVLEVASDLADAFEHINPGFNRTRFMKAVEE